MDSSLSSRCMTAILDGVIDGTLVNFDHVPIVIRQSIFANIQQVVRVRRNCDLPAVLRRGQFFDGFEQMHLLDWIECSKYFQLLSTIATEIDRPGSCLGSELVSLRLNVCCGYLKCSSTDRSIETSDMLRSKAVVCRLITACRNLRRLHLYIRRHLCKASLNDRLYMLRDPLYPIAKTIRAQSDNRASLEQLTLQRCSTWDFHGDFTMFDSLRVLELRSCRLYPDEWSQLLERCSRTLQSLTLSDCRFRDCLPDTHVELVALTSLNISATEWYNNARLLLSTETLDRVQDGRVCLVGNSKPDSFERIRCCLSPNLEVAYYVRKQSDFAGLSSAHQQFGQRLVEVRIRGQEQFLDADELDEMVSALNSIQVLTMEGGHFERYNRRSGDQFLRRFLSDADRCAKLRWLQIRFNLDRETLRLVFRQCYNLEFLLLVEGSKYLDVSEITDDDLTVWAANGAKPKEVYLGFRPLFTVDGVNRLLHNCEDDLIASFFDERRQFVQKNDKLIADRLSGLTW